MKRLPWPPPLEAIEWEKCSRDPHRFINRHCQIYDATAKTWIPFRLWPQQTHVVDTIHGNQLTVILKARQLGLTWICLAYILWLMLFNGGAATALIFSKREEESNYLLGDERLRGMHSRLPKWMQASVSSRDAIKTWLLANGSVARAFPSNAGDSYTATIALVDEADLVPDLGRLLRSVKPTIDAGGKLILLSRADKTTPESQFKRVYTEARRGTNGWAPIFMPWYVRPERNQAWYDAQKADIYHRTGSLDDLHEQYPATDVEALSARTLDKRIAPQWLQACWREQAALSVPGCPSIPGLEVYQEPAGGRVYVIGGDPAEGNPTSDDSAIEVLDFDSGDEVACLSGKFQPAVFAAHIDAIGRWYNNAGVMVERNNHGHAVLLWLADNSQLPIMPGHDGKAGWLSNSKGKALLYDACADACREQNTRIHNLLTFNQLGSIEGSTLLAPEGQQDDRADAFALATTVVMGGKRTVQYSRADEDDMILTVG